METHKLNTLQSKRLTKKLSCQDVANMLNISKSYYWELENGKRRLFYQDAVKLAKIFKTKPDKLFLEDFK